jgi:hypothetical protein
MLNKISCFFIVCGILPLYFNVSCRYRVAEVEWVHDIMPPEGTKEKEEVSSFNFDIHFFVSCAWIAFLFL